MGLLASLSCCDRDPPSPDPSKKPPPQVLATSPRADAKDVSLAQALRIRFDRLLRPSSVLRQSVQVGTGLPEPEAGAPTAPPDFLLEPRWDPYERVASFLLDDGARWLPDTLYFVRLRLPPPDDEIVGIRAFDGAALASEVDFRFTTGAERIDDDTGRDERWPVGRYCDASHGSTIAGNTGITVPGVRGIFERSCASASCHGATSSALGLDLSSSSSIRRTAIGVAAHQTLTGASVGPTSSNPRVFGQAMPRIDPGNPGNSYLLYKVIINPKNYETIPNDDAQLRAWVGDLGSAGPPSADELTRLRGSFVRMHPMPLDGELSSLQMRAIVAWIGDGAKTEDCP